MTIPLQIAIAVVVVLAALTLAIHLYHETPEAPRRQNSPPPPRRQDERKQFTATHNNQTFPPGVTPEMIFIALKARELETQGANKRQMTPNSEAATVMRVGFSRAPYSASLNADTQALIDENRKVVSSEGYRIPRIREIDPTMEAREKVERERLHEARKKLIL